MELPRENFLILVLSRIQLEFLKVFRFKGLQKTEVKCFFYQSIAHENL